MLTNYMREFFLSRIIAGYLTVKTKDTELRVYCPTKEQNYSANMIYVKAYDNCKKAGIMDEEDCKQMLIDNGMWNEIDETEYVDIMPKHIEYWKEELFKSFEKKKELDRIRKYLTVAKNRYEELFHLRHTFSHASCDGIANFARQQYLVENCTFLASGKKYKWSKVSLSSLVTHVQSNFIYESQIRELSHTNPWDNIWLAGKKTGRLFDKPATELSNEQVRLICWSSMYDNIRENSDCPTDEVIADDDALDGWLILQRKEREQRSFEKSIENKITSDKIKNATEVYIMAGDEDNDTFEEKVRKAEKIDNMNSAYAKMIKKQRYNIIDSKGEVNEGALPDVQNDLIQQITQAFGSKMKGN